LKVLSFEGGKNECRVSKGSALVKKINLLKKKNIKLTHQEKKVKSNLLVSKVSALLLNQMTM
jgi:hypothetical protein